MQKDLETGFVTYDREQCASCYMCVHRSKNGQTPAPMCVEECPMGAITLEEVAE